MKTVEEIKGDPDLSRRMAAYWKTQVESADENNARWHKRGDLIVKRYKDERDKASEEGTRRLNMLWSNISILAPAIYGRRPVPIAERRFLDRDPVGRLSAQMVERAMRNEIEDNGFHAAIKRAVKDYLLPGRGVCWVRYEPQFGQGVSLPPTSPTDISDAKGNILDSEDEPEDEATEKLEETGEQIIAESCPVDYIHWKDFYMFPSRARTWDEVTAIGKKVYLSKEECIERFGEEVGSKIEADATLSVSERQANYSITTFQDQNERKRVIYEIWNRSDRRVYWISTGCDDLCDVLDDPLELRGFFPTPEPLSSTLTNDSMTPVPDYIEYQDQAIQIDELTQRISLLTKACKVAGVYDGANRPLRRLLDESVENELIPVDDWARYGDKGGVAGAISFLPLKEIMETLDVLMGVKERMLQDLDRVTGISDVLRGTTDGRETLGGTRLKTNNAGTRIDERRNDVARFARDIIGLCAEVIAKRFTARSIIQTSGILFEDEFAPIQRLKELLTEAPTTSLAPAAPFAGGVAPLSPQAQAQPGLLPAGAPGLGAPGMPAAAPAPQPPSAGQAAPPQPPVGQGTDGLQELIPEVQKLMTRISKAITLLRNDIERGYRIDIEIDSTIAGDAQQERQDAVEFLGAVTKFIETAAMVGGQQPMLTPLLGKMLQFGVRKFRTGRDLESIIDDYVDKAEKKAREMAANPNKGPSPEQLKLEAEKMKLQADQAQAQASIARAKIEAESEQANHQRETERAAMEHQAKLQQMQLDMEARREEHGMRLQQIQAERITKEIAHRQEAAKAADPTLPNLELIKMHSAAAQAQAQISKAQIEAESEKHNHQLETERKRMEHEARRRELEMQREMKKEEHQARLTQLRHQRVGARHDHIMKTEQMLHQRNILKEKASRESAKR